MTAAPAGGMISLIARKRGGGEVTEEELSWLCREYVAARVPDYQVAAWLMAICCRGMSERETLALTRAMVASGDELDWSALGRPVVDKHSTGGVGDKTSLVLVPLMAAAGLAFVKMSGRGLGHTGGTLDKLESIRGFRVELEPDALRAQVERIGCALVGQSPTLVPADKLLYALRDVTATVDCMPLIAASIMSKKLAAGAPVVVLDVKYGSGAFMSDIGSARELARAMVRIGDGAGRRVRAVLSPMSAPLGEAVGNALEVREAIASLRGAGPPDLWALTEELGVHLLRMTGIAETEAVARERLRSLRADGSALRAFRALVEAQGGDPEMVDDPGRIAPAAVIRPLHADREGWIRVVDARTVGEVALDLGAGRRTKSDALDLAAGVRVLCRPGDRIERGAVVAEIHARSEDAARGVVDRLRAAFRVVDESTVPSPPVFEVVDAEGHDGR